MAAVGPDSYFRYRLEPGEAARGTLRLISRSRRAEHLELRGADVTTSAGGGLAYGSGAPVGEGRWVKIAKGVTVRPGEVVDVPFTVTADTGATPGDHLASIVAVNRRDIARASDASGRRGFSLRYLPRLAMTVRVAVPGPATHALTAGGLTIDVAPTSTTVGLLLRNTGERLIGRTRGSLVLMQGDRVLLRRRVDIGAFVPQTEIRVPLPLSGRVAKGRYRVTGELRPRGAQTLSIDDDVTFGDKEAAELKTETGHEARAGTPVWLLAVLVAAGVLLAVLAYALLSARRRLAALSG